MHTITVPIKTTFASLVAAKVQGATRLSRLVALLSACCIIAYGYVLNSGSPFLQALGVAIVAVVALKSLVIFGSASIQARSKYNAVVTFSDADIVVQDATGVRSVGWSWLKFVAENRLHFFLVWQVHPRRVLVLRKTVLPAADLAALRSQLVKRGLLA